MHKLTNFVMTQNTKYGAKLKEKLDFTSYPFIPHRLLPPLMMSHPVTLRSGMRNIISRLFSLLAVREVVSSVPLFHPHFSGELFSQLKRRRLPTMCSSLNSGKADQVFALTVLNTDLKRETKENQRIQYHIIC